MEVGSDREEGEGKSRTTKDRRSRRVILLLLGLKSCIKDSCHSRVLYPRLSTEDARTLVSKDPSSSLFRVSFYPPSVPFPTTPLSGLDPASTRFW